MAEESGGGGLSKKLGPLPAWGWAVLLGGVGGIIWFLRKSQANNAAQDKTGSGTDEGSPDRTTIVPVNQGLGADQAQAILDAIKDLQGEISKEEQEDEDEDKPPSTTLPGKPPGPAPKPPKPPTHSKPPVKKPPAQPKSKFITIKSGSGASFSSIAAQYGHSWRDLWNYQLQPGVRPASTQATLRKRGPDHSLFGGSTVAIPASWKKK